MQLVITRYFDRNPEEIESRLDQAIPIALDAAADRIDSRAIAPHGEPSPNGIVVSGLDILDGTEINWDGGARLTTVRVTVPWDSEDSASGQKLLAASRFAQVFSTEACAA
jgi:hypothetical protein